MLKRCNSAHAIPGGRMVLSSLLLGSGLLAMTGLAQLPPKLNSISPEWIQRGTTVQIVFNGENLAGATGFVFNGDPGLTASNLPPVVPPKPVVTIESNLGGISRAEPGLLRDDKRLVAVVTATADAPLGAREVRVVSPAGVSNPLQINIGQFPEIPEQEPNGTLEQAQKITLPAVVSGTISAAAQVDYYRFKAAKGQELVLDVDASRRGSPLDSSLVILSADGKELARNEDEEGLDSVLLFTVPEEGEYVVQLRDFRYQGGANYTYRLSAGALPYLESLFPFGGQRGKQVEITLAGRNLAGTTKMVLSLAPNAPLGRQEIRAHTPNGYSNLRPFHVSEHPDTMESEPNNTPDKLNTVSIPVVINGRIGSEKDIDRFKFKSDKDQKLVCDVTASRFNSRLDPLLVLTDAQGGVIAQNDDSGSMDARIEFDAKKDAEYILSLRDLTERGGEEFGYRLAIRPPSAAAEAGFTARFLPDTLRVHRGGKSKLRCELTPMGGFNGPVRFTLQDLPAGIFGDPLVLPTGVPASGLMVISASKEAALGTFPVRVLATATVGTRNVTQTAEPISGERGARQGFLTVLEAAPFTLEPATLSAEIEQNQTATIEVMVQRQEGFTGEIKLSAEGFSAGRDAITKSFDLKEVTLKGKETVGKLGLFARLDSEVGTRTVVVRGEAIVDGQAITEFTQSIPISVTQFPLVVSSTLPRLSLTVLPPGSTSAAGEALTTIRVERRAGFGGEVALTVEGLPAGVNSTVEKIPAGVNETALKLTATEKAALGTNFSFTVVGTCSHNDRTYRHRSGAIALAVNAPEPTDPPATPAAAAAVGSVTK